jgi:hypothetical protein
MKNAARMTFNRALPATVIVLSFVLPFDQLAYAGGYPVVSAPIQDVQPAPAPRAPIPIQIAAAHKIFLVNDGADANFPLSAERSYSEIYARLQDWGHFQLVRSPAEADLIFRLREIAPITGVSGDRNGVYSTDSPVFQLTIKDPKTNVSLWTITSPVQLAGRKKARERWLNIALINMVSRIKVLASQPLSATETADLTTAPRYHGAAFAITLVAVTAGAAVATGLIMKHEYDNSVANQNAALCAQNPFFCNAPTP